MPVIARDSFAAGHLVYAWPFPIGPECEVACQEDELVVMCPAWTIGDRLGPGRHHWRTPDPTRPVAAYFVSFGAVEVEFEMVTRFAMPATLQPIELRASGSVLVRCADPSVLIAQFIGLPFDSIDAGIRRSVARSVERMVARLLIRRIVLSGTIEAILDLPSIIAEVVSYNPTAGAVFGIELSQLLRLQIEANDGHNSLVAPVAPPPMFAPAAVFEEPPLPSPPLLSSPPPSVVVNGWETPTQPNPAEASAIPEPVIHQDTMRGIATGVISGSIAPKPALRPTTPSRRALSDTLPAPLPPIPAPPSRVVAPTSAAGTPPPDMSAHGAAQVRLDSQPDARSSIMAIGARIGDRQVTSGEIHAKVEPGKRVLVPGPHGLMQSATVRQLLSGYYELELGATGETIWVPMAHVVAE
jgi:hypothetical protein